MWLSLACLVYGWLCRPGPFFTFGCFAYFRCFDPLVEVCAPRGIPRWHLILHSDGLDGLEGRGSQARRQLNHFFGPVCEGVLTGSHYTSWKSVDHRWLVAAALSSRFSSHRFVTVSSLVGFSLWTFCSTSMVLFDLLRNGCVSWGAVMDWKGV